MRSRSRLGWVDVPAFKGGAAGTLIAVRGWDCVMGRREQLSDRLPDALRVLSTF
jgi:hypothetical protein